MKHVFPRFESPQMPGLAFSLVPPPSLCDPKLYLVLIVLEVVGAGADGAVGILFVLSLLFQFDVFSMAPEDDGVTPLVVVVNVTLLVVAEEPGTTTVSLDLLAKVLLVLKKKLIRKKEKYIYQVKFLVNIFYISKQ